MKTISFRLSAVFVATFFSVLTTDTCLAGPSYIVTDLGPFGISGASNAFAVNNSGQVAGWYWPNSTNDDIHGFRWQENGGMEDLGTLGRKSYARAINNFGKVVGYSEVVVSGNVYSRAFLYDDSGMQNLGGFPDGSNAWNKNKYNSYALGINDYRQIVGASDTVGWYDSVGGYMNRTHAFLLDNDGTMQDLGTLGERNSYAYGINNAGQVVGSSNNNDDYIDGSTRAFIWQSGRGMQDLGSLGGYSIALAINNNSQVVGWSNNADGKERAFFWQNGVGMQDLGTLPAGSTPYNSFNSGSHAHSINNKGQVVGDSYNSMGSSHAFLSDSNSGQMQDLNNLVAPSQWTLLNAAGINDFGQIASWATNAGQYHGFLLTPVGNVQSYRAEPSVIPPIERLAKWDGTNWVSVMPGDLSSGNIHVLVHGWGAGLRAFADAGGHIWDPSVTTESGPSSNNQYTLLENAAKAIEFTTNSPDHKIIAFDWLDMSATDTNWPTEAHKSRDKTDEAAGYLFKALQSASDFTGDYSGKLHVMGMSHGARVAALTTERLYNRGKTDSVVVDQLTLGDSPENYKADIAQASNNLSLKLRDSYIWEKLLNIKPPINIGRSEGTTFVDNYFSLFGQIYVRDDDIVNVQLNPDPTKDDEEKHGYPIDWYSRATRLSTNLALGWSPLEGDLYQTLAPSYEQDSLVNGVFDPSREFILKESDTGEYFPVQRRDNMNLATLITEGTVAEIPNGKLFTEASPAFWHTGFTKNPNDTTIEFSYQFLNAGDGDQLGLWIDDELRFIITGELIGTEIMTSDIDIFGLINGEHILSVALHNYGDANASVQVFDFTMLSVSEPSSLYLLCAAAIFVAIATLLRRKLMRA